MKLFKELATSPDPPRRIAPPGDKKMKAQEQMLVHLRGAKPEKVHDPDMQQR